MLLAVAEIRRAKARFALLTAAVALLVFLILFLRALFGGLITDFVGAVENQDSPILVFNEDARRNVEASFLPPGVEDAVGAVDGVAETGLIGQSTYTVLAGGEDQDAALFGYELGGLGEPLTLTEGRLPNGPNEAVASEADAGKGFGIGEVVAIVGESGPEITVVGLGEDLRWSVSPTLFVSYSTFEAAQLAVNPEATVVLASLVAVEAEEGVADSDLTDRIDAAIPGVEALTNAESVETNPSVQGVNNSAQIILLLAFLVVGILVGFFFLILTAQKAKPLTLLRAVGAKSSYLMRNLAAQVGAVLFVGSVAAIVMLVFASGTNLTGDLSISLDPVEILVTILGVAVLSLIGAAVAIFRVIRIDPLLATRDSSRSF